MTQGGITSPTIFNLAVDSVVCHWLSLMVDDKTVTQDGLWNVVGRSLGLF